MLAFVLDITQNKPANSKENENDEVKQYMDYQRKLNHINLVKHSLEYAKNQLQENIDSSESEKLSQFLKNIFPISHQFADVETLMLMLRKLMNSQNSSNNWYRMNSFYHAVVFESMKEFVKFYNLLLVESPERAKALGVSERTEVDFEDWSYLYFPDMDFHIGKSLSYTHYPFAKRNKTIEEKWQEGINEGKSKAEALKAIQADYEIDDTSVKILLGQKISSPDLELLYTSVENPIYEALTEVEDGRWGVMDGESLLDHTYYMGAHLKVWEWRKREEVEAETETIMSQLTKSSKK
ncbi:uncharacterized protein METZ01_LOCUS333861 [marine metagenome]|uniref:Uncharacterized protein n=1 Tax=marine metagenome TaxID=408172 RepID=A0A382Q7J5_9ZZZZ